MTRFPYSQRQAVAKGDVKETGRPVYEGDIHLIFASPFLVAAQQSHFHKAEMKQPIGVLTYPSYQWLMGPKGALQWCRGVFLCPLCNHSDSMLLEGTP